MHNVLASVMDGVKSGTLVTMDKTLVGNEVPEEVLVPNLESDFIFTSSTGTITGYKGTRKDVVIPSTINGVAVKVIGVRSFMNKGLTSVYIPDGVTSIGNEAFECTGYGDISFVRLPESLTSIGEFAFYGNKITSVKIPKGVTRLEKYTFAYNNIQSLELHDELTVIMGGAFQNNQITTLELPVNLTTLGSDAFRDNLIKTVRVPKGITTMSIGVFYYNPLESIELALGTSYTMNIYPSSAKPFPDTTVVNFY